MPSKKRIEDVEIKITLAAPDAPERLLANAELIFQSGLLEGLRLTGFALWKAKEEKGEGFVSVTFPSRSLGSGRFYEYVRTVSGDAKDLRKLKGAIVAAYKARLAEAEASDPESNPSRGGASSTE
jgi:hypothetical protein